MSLPVLAVDTQIVMIGCRMSDREPRAGHCALLQAFRDKALLALDKHTRQEYDNKLGATSEGRYWLKQLGSDDRIEFYQTVPKEKKKTKVALGKVGFGGGDLKFVRLALATNTRRLIAEETHFVNVASLLRKEEGVIIHDADSACSFLGNPPDDSSV